LIPKASEDTVTSILRDELQKLGVKAEAFAVVDTPAGFRKPGLLCTNGGDYPVEAKYTERDLLVAIAKVENDYLKHYKMLGIRGGFAILYPHQLSVPMPAEEVRNTAFRQKFKLVAMFPPEDPRPFTVHEGGLQEIVRTLVDHILAPTKHVEPKIDFIIDTLRITALYILNGLRHLART
jgi:hypothetical protein